MKVGYSHKTLNSCALHKEGSKKMKKIILFSVALMFLSCEDIKEQLQLTKDNKSSVYYLVDFGDEDVLYSSSTTHVTGNEYIKFTSDRVYWNNRDGGTYNTTYSFVVSGNTWYLTDVSGGDSYTMTIIERTSSVLKTYSTDGYFDSFYRLWRAK